MFFCKTFLFTKLLKKVYYLSHFTKYQSRMMVNKTNIENNNNDEFKYLPDELCNSEPFVYKHIIINGTKDPEIISGKKFDCNVGFPYLQKYGLLSNALIPEIPINPKNIVFAIAADVNYYLPSRALIATIKQHFGEKVRIIYYDLGKSLDNYGITEEMKGICNFGARKFQWDILPEDAKGVKMFAWKVLIIAELFKEFETFWYLDSSIYFESGDFSPFYEMMNNKNLTPFQMSGSTGHSIRHATNKDMYKYIPLDMTIPRKHDMLEANMMLIHRSETTRKIIKWSVLCAVTRDCIEPPDSTLGCPREKDGMPEGLCHRQDQSLYNILLANLEQQWINEEAYIGRSVITHIMPNHPKNLKQRHQTRRMQTTNKKIDKCSPKN